MRARGIFILASLASAALGFATGYLTGQSGPDATVLAAVLPAVITGGGWALLAYKFRSQSGTWNVEHAAISAMIIAFSVSLLAGAHIGDYAQEVADRISDQRSIKARHDFAKACSREQFVVNEGRKALGLEPLPTEVFCFPGMSSPRNPSGT